MYQRFHAVRSEDEAVEAIGALREVLELEDPLCALQPDGGTAGPDPILFHAIAAVLNLTGPTLESDRVGIIAAAPELCYGPGRDV